MHKFKIPQEVQREDRIFGPITFRRLIILTLGGGLTYVLFMSLSSAGVMVWGIPTFFSGALTFSLAFIEPFGMRFSKFILRMLEFSFLPRVRLWDKRFSQDIAFEFYASEHRKWLYKNEKVVPQKTMQQKKALQREKLSAFSPLLDLDLSDIDLPSQHK